MIKIEENILFKLFESVEMITRTFSQVDFDWWNGTYQIGPKNYYISNLVSRNEPMFQNLHDDTKADVIRAVDFYMNTLADLNKNIFTSKCKK